MTSTQTFTVAGMTCEHCVASVTEEVSELAGVRSVEVDLPTGLLTVGADGALPESAVRSAVEGAGYRLV